MENYYEKHSVIESLNGDAWDGNIVLGQPERHGNENSEFQLYKCICLKKDLHEAENFDFYSKILT